MVQRCKFSGNLFVRFLEEQMVKEWVALEAVDKGLENL